MVARAFSRKNGNSYNAAPVLHPAASARAAGLRYMSDDLPGIARRRCGQAFRYLRPDGSAVRDRESLGRIRSLAIPPAWREVWICPQDDGHLQATGRDARLRKQYRYHRRWREVRDETKYGRLVAFAQALPRIRRRVQHDLAVPGLPREKVLAAVVHLLESTRIRVGNAQYARLNDSFGLTTLRERQVRVRGGKLTFRFRGKSGVHHDIELDDRRLAAIVRRMQDLPGEELFQYVDETGETRRIESADVNAYLKEISSEDFTSKDFRTWAGTVLAARALQRLKRFGSQTEAKRNVAQAIETVARQLGNTMAVCRKCYVHPAILEAYMDATLLPVLQRRPEEAAVLAVLQARLKRDAQTAERSGAGGSLEPFLARSLAIAARRLRKRTLPQPASRGAT
jgi:DNA topoisomerase-1